MKRLLSAILALAMVVVLLPSVALADGTSATPTATIVAATKASIIQTSVTYTLTNGASYAADTVFKVYANVNKSAYATGITASLSGSTLTLSHASNLPVGKVYIAAAEAGKTESGTLELQIKVNTGKYSILEI